MQLIRGLETDSDVIHAYLFHCDDHGLFVISSDRSGANIPRDVCPKDGGSKANSHLAFAKFYR
jgi:hypothetical protein